MKKLLLLTIAALIAGSTMAQNEKVHVFRNDKNFNTFNGSDVKSITYQGEGTSFNKMLVEEVDGSTTSLDMSTIDSVAVRDKSIPEVYVSFPLADNGLSYWDESVASSLGKKYEYVNTTIRIDGNGMYDDLDETSIVFRGRGNSTWNMEKKPWRIKFDSKTSICGFAKSKKYVLLANYIDCSIMRNTIAFWVANYLEMPFANHIVPVKLYINGVDRGAYMMTEQQEIGGASVDIEETEGIMFEFDSNYDEDFKFAFNLNYYSSIQNGSIGQSTLPVMVSEPDLTEIAPELGKTADEYFNEWKNDFTAAATAIMSTPADGSLKDYIDIESVVNFFMVNAIANNHEMQHPKSFKIFKRSFSSVYEFGPVWDFDWAYTYQGTAGSHENASANVPLVRSNGDCGGYTFIKKLLSNNEIRTLYKQKWDEFVENGYPQLLAYMEGYATLVEPSAKENGLIWPEYRGTTWKWTESSFDYRNHYAKLKQWLDDRIAYCNSHVNYGLYE